jgi:hypothetical protein
MAVENTKLDEANADVGGSLVAFWKNDRFPYVLGSPVDTINADGTVKCQGYPSYRFTPILLLPLAAGLKVGKQLAEIEARRGRELEELEARYLKEIEQVFPGKK